MVDMLGNSHYFLNEVTEDLLDIKGMGSNNSKQDNIFYTGEKINVDIDLF